MKNIYFYLDDSGTLHKNEINTHFIYAGFCFSSQEERDVASRRYANVVNDIKSTLSVDGELKSYGLEKKYKNRLYRILSNNTSIGASVEISKLYRGIIGNKNSIVRYKDYVVKILIKRELEQKIKEGIIKKDEDITIHLYIDEQPTGTDGKYMLRASILEELKFGMISPNGYLHKPLFSSSCNVKVNVNYCDSKRNYLIQASDILANRIFASFRDDNKQLRAIPNHRCVKFP